MKRACKQLVAALALTVACAGVAQAELWTGGGDGVSYGDTNNWDVPATAFPGSTRDINGAFTVTRSGNVTVNRTFVNGGAVLNVTGGTHSDSQSGNTIRNFIGSSGAGTVNMSGGSWDIGHITAVGGNGTGVFNLSGGDLNISRGGNTLAGNPNSFGGNSGGSLSVGYGSGSGLFNVTGGSLITRIGAEVGDKGTFRVLGDDATQIGIGSSGTLDGHWWQQAGGVLSMGIDSTGVTKIFIDDTDQVTADPYVHFQDGAVLDLSFFGTTPVAGTWTLMELENNDIEDLGLELSGDTASGWSFNVDNSGANGLLTATYVIPEPATLGMVAAFGAGMLFIRRRFMI
ncbi:hypothetical protein PDESU_00285 [Pontiella desulfatans]|uniref:PEP-CTERM protein-sorting domain-containing protein n=1 Tax=Pontiella desulfatans TaxID=2750659 RepID=A0A6C2TVU5_PONDE|nr:PEP-CTERM sorting domain-containing protein [Pontiella desulfatans]VGO11739.1 hypothetical protein PDESU_00285 [Pontiella desulfatans]